MSDPRPPATHGIEIPSAWIDYNGHLTDWAYGIIVSSANEALLASVDLSSDYLARTGRSLNTVESHIWYRAEVKQGLVRTASHVLELGGKSLRVRTTLIREDDVEAATSELVYLHVDHASGSTVAFDEGTSAALASLLAPTD